MCISKSFRSPGATAQLSGARSTAELIAHYAGLPVTRGKLPREGGACMQRNGGTQPPLNFRILSGAEQSKIARLLSACSDLGK